MHLCFCNAQLIIGQVLHESFYIFVSVCVCDAGLFHCISVRVVGTSFFPFPL